MTAAARTFNGIALPQAQLDLALVRAIARGQADKVAALIDQGAAKDWQSRRQGKSLLQIAAKHNRTDVAAVLIAKGVPLDLQDKSGRTPLFEALHLNHLDIAHLLLDSKADPNIRTNWNMSPAVWPLIHCQMDIVEKLLERGLDLSAKDNEGRTALFHATCFRSLPILKRLLKESVNIEDVNNLKQTPLGVCATDHHIGHLLALIKAGAVVDAKDYQGDTALNRAVRYGHLRAVKTLVARGGADLHLANDEGMSPMQTALERLEDVRKYPNASDYAQQLKKAQDILEFMRRAHDHYVIEPFRRGTGARAKVMRALQLKKNP